MRQQAELLGPHVDVRGYRWDRPLGLFPTLGAFHGVELPYVFGTGLLIGDELTASEQGIATWRSIAAGSPTIDGALNFTSGTVGGIDAAISRVLTCRDRQPVSCA